MWDKAQTVSMVFFAAHLSPCCVACSRAASIFAACATLSLSLPLAQMRLTGDAFESRSRSASNNVNGYDLTIAIVVAIQESPMDQSSWLQRSSSFSCRFQASKSCLVFCLLLGRSAHTSGCKDRQIGSNWASLSMKQFYPAFESCS